MSRFDVDLDLPIGAHRVRARFESDARAIAIVGPSGIGKSTLLRALVGLVPGVRGRVSIGGTDLGALAPTARGLGWVPQDGLLFPHLTVRENVAFGARGASIDTIAAAMGIAKLLDRAPATLSGGERQRAAIARALARRPTALLLDEPLAALDREGRKELAERIGELCEARGTLRILVAHDETDVASLAEERFALGEQGVTRLSV